MMARIPQVDPVSWVLGLAFVLGLGLFVTSAWHWARSAAANRDIRALAAGHDIAIARRARPELVAARGDFLARYERPDEAEVLLARLIRAGREDLAADLYLGIGNARMAAAFAAAQRQDLDTTAAHVRIAKALYRKVLTLQPEAFDAKVNLDVASRLVRDFPDNPYEEGGDPEQPQPKNLWADLPALPRGLP